MADTDRKGFLLYHSIEKPLQKLTDAQCGRLFRAIVEYSKCGTIPAFGDPAVDMAFEFIRTSVDEGAAAWEEEQKKRQDRAMKGADARWNKHKKKDA